MGKGCEASITPSGHAAWGTSNVQLTGTLWALSFWVFMLASLHWHDWWNYWPLVMNSTFSLSPWWLQSRTECPNPLIWLWSSWWPALIQKPPRGHQPLVNSLAYKKTLITLKIPSILRAVCQQTRKKTEYIYSQLHSCASWTSAGASSFIKGFDP